MDEIAPASQAERTKRLPWRRQAASPEDRVWHTRLDEALLQRSTSLRGDDERRELRGSQRARELDREPLRPSGGKGVEQHHDAHAPGGHAASDLTAAITRSTCASVTAGDSGMLNVRSEISSATGNEPGSNPYFSR